MKLSVNIVCAGLSIWLLLTLYACSCVNVWVGKNTGAFHAGPWFFIWCSLVFMKEWLWKVVLSITFFFCWFAKILITKCVQIWHTNWSILCFVFAGDNRTRVWPSWDWGRAPQNVGSSPRPSARKCGYLCFIWYTVRARSASCSDSWKWCSKIRAVGSEVIQIL
jgi:hypothetical protein